MQQTLQAIDKQNWDPEKGEWLGKGHTANWQAWHLEFKVCFM